MAIGTIRGFRSVLHSVLRHNNLDISNNRDISDVIKSFVLERPPAKKKSIAWNVDIVLKYLCSERFEQLDKIPLKELTKKTVFLLALALAKRVIELQALSKDVGFCKEGALVSLLLDFRAKNDNKFKGLPRSFVVKGLTQLVGPEEERKLCPVRALRAYLERTKGLRQEQVENLFLAPKDPSRPASKNALAYFIKSTIILHTTTTSIMLYSTPLPNTGKAKFFYPLSNYTCAHDNHPYTHPSPVTPPRMRGLPPSVIPCTNLHFPFCSYYTYILCGMWGRREGHHTDCGRY